MFCCISSHVNIRGDELADKKAKAALHLPESDFRIPHTEISKYQSLFNNQIYKKLHETSQICFSKDKVILKRKDQMLL